MRQWILLSALCLLGCPNSRHVCGDETCEEGETETSCVVDCGPPMCGDGVCGPSWLEAAGVCPTDCDLRPECGDGVCASTETCAACPRDCQVACETTCGPSNCPGCCAGNTCLAGSALDACGSGGLVCSSCGVNTVCDGQCATDGSTWNFFIHSYEVGPSQDGVPYDHDGPPDLAFQVTSPSTHRRMAIVVGPEDAASHEFTPPELIGANIPADELRGYLIFEMYERDGGRVGGGVGTFHTLDPFSFDGSVMTAEFPSDPRMGSGFRVRWHLERAD